MIKYALICEADHEFESWFPDSASYDKQVKRGLVTCPVCDSAKISKAIMAPNVARKDQDRTIAADNDDSPSPAAPAAPAQNIALLDEQQQQLRGMIRELHEKIVANTDDVGENFPEEARKMHEGETPARSIRGKASFEEARELLEDGIPVLPIPDLPEERN